MLQQQNKYLEMTIQTATPAQLLIMLCDGAIRFCRKAIDSLNENKHQEAHNYLMRVQDIINEFVITLDKKSSVAEGLLQLYDYFIHRLMEANINKKAEPAEEVLQFLMELKNTWVEANKLAIAQKTTGDASHA
ncbi:flagellar export chaperone FliS [Paenibacillus thalictri]|uniref:Flagellar secretion chaperone FliS n=1 Tax=Paenibacillus thalictri TaxID=2527873 RepID=A0A4V2J3K0_9BACL|nr:flagellar export chaperone FliS [Paenibacillus thalictri]TBL73017.1 flagellar export chaperone FliS [Paenibacillus thalictri]